MPDLECRHDSFRHILFLGLGIFFLPSYIFLSIRVILKTVQLMNVVVVVVVVVATIEREVLFSKKRQQGHLCDERLSTS